MLKGGFEMNAKMLVVGVFILLAISWLISPNLIIRVADAQEAATSTMQSFIEGLVKRMNDERGFRIFVEFEHPLVGNESTWEIGDPNDELQRSIAEVGEDYVCFQEIALAADGRRCTPFNNIVSIFYLNN
jgi:hypothetical protein